MTTKRVFENEVVVVEIGIKSSHSEVGLILKGESDDGSLRFIRCESSTTEVVGLERGESEDEGKSSDAGRIQGGETGMTGLS
jgi:hypothetical protein